MWARIPVILLGIPAVYGLLVAAGDLARLTFIALVAILGQYELIKMLGRESNFSPLPEWIASLGIFSAAHFYGDRGLIYSLVYSIIFLMIFTVIRGLRGDGFKRFCIGIFSVIYLPFCLGFYYLLSLSSGGQFLFLILAAIWALDMGAYAFGMALRGPRLSPNISPNKTISGAFGGAFCCIVFFVIVRHYQLIELTDIKFWGLAFSVAIIGQIADLFESVLKRESEIKDSGALLGAHGGVLDRIDSILFLGPVCYSLIII